jgi:hypothetical protein
MSLIHVIEARHPSDILNEGAVYSAEGETGGTVTDSIIVPIGAERNAAVTSFALSTSSTTPRLVRLGFKKGAEATQVFFRGYVSANGPIVVKYPDGGWKRGNLDQDVVITSADDVAFALDAKVLSHPTALEYIEYEGAKNPSGHGRARFADESGADRGQQEV